MKVSPRWLRAREPTTGCCAAYPLRIASSVVTASTCLLSSCSTHCEYFSNSTTEASGCSVLIFWIGVEPVTVYRWCRQGRLNCLKPGKSWRIRRSVLEAFLRRSEQPRTLAAHLGAFLELPDQVLAVAEDAPLLSRLDAAFFQAGEARGGVLVKLYEPKQTTRLPARAASSPTPASPPSLPRSASFC